MKASELRIGNYVELLGKPSVIYDAKKHYPQILAKMAVEFADALLNELKKSKTMKWIELPKKYKDLEKDFDSLAFIFTHSNDISRRFRFKDTPQGNEFWSKCHNATTISELPPIPKSNQKCQD